MAYLSAALLIVASTLVTLTVSHDLLYKPIQGRGSKVNDLPDVIPIFKKVPAFKRPESLHLPSVKSPTSHGNRCRETEQKCFLSSGQSGCCPYQNGTCCSDKLTCCPTGYECNIKESTCVVVKQNKKVDAVVCPDGQSQCPDGSTCCKLQSGDWGCCPLEKATCCSDGIHCCPNGYKCDVGAGTCTKGDLTHVFLKTKAKPTEMNLSRCCKFLSGSTLCCKNDLVCDPSTYHCISQKLDVDQIPTAKMVSHIDAVVPTSRHISMFSSQHRFVSCAVGHKCGTTSTCCLSNGVNPRCCNLSNAVCCPGGLHCCPSGFTCNRSGKCTFGRRP